MFEALFHRAEVKVESVVSQAMYRVIVALFAIVCVAFLVSAAYDELLVKLDPIEAKLALAGAFAVISLLSAAILLRRSSSSTSSTTTASGTNTFHSETEPHPGVADGLIDSDMVTSAMSVAGPLVLPLVLRNLVKNLPLILVLLSVFYVATRPTGSVPTDTTSSPPM